MQQLSNIKFLIIWDLGQGKLRVMHEETTSRGTVQIYFPAVW